MTETKNKTSLRLHASLKYFLVFAFLNTEDVDICNAKQVLQLGSLYISCGATYIHKKKHTNFNVCVYLALTNKRNEIGKEDLRVCPREDWAGVTYAILPISFKLSQFMRVTKLLKNPELFGLPANPWVIKAPHEILG